MWLMVTEQDSGNGVVKVDWASVRNRVAKVEPTFAKIVDEISLIIHTQYF